MKNFIIYNKEGKILRVGICSETDLEYQKSPDEFLLEGVADFTSQYIENGIVVDMPNKPAGEYVFNYTTKQWEFDRNTAEYKALSKRDILLAEGPDRISPLWWNSMTPLQQQEWEYYRQALLDITGQADYPEFIVWPIKP